MRRLHLKSFRFRLFLSFLAVSLVPLLLCSSMLLQIFRLRLTEAAKDESASHLNSVTHILDTTCNDLALAVRQVQQDPIIAQALLGDDTKDTRVYSRLFDATKGQRRNARFDLYDTQGNWRYSTQNSPDARTLPIHWGILHQAAHTDGLRFSASEDVSDTSLPMLQGAASICTSDGQRAGFLVVSMNQSHLLKLFNGLYGSRNDLLLLDSRWRPVFCTQPDLAVALAPQLRQRLLDGQPLSSDSEDFMYCVERHAPSGLNLVIQRPRVLDHSSMILLHTVSILCALICIGISVLLSWRLSRQMSKPIRRLHRAMNEVVNNNLEVQITSDRDDELGQLAQRFNGMVVALKHNQEELVEHERELNEAQIRMLQAQLNPHFLCNTLDTMKWISKINQVPQVAVMSTNLADILRFCISPEEFVPLWREVDVLQRYIEIQKIRLSGAFSFASHVPPELEECLVPKMMLQPLVENAILHGIEDVENGTITVTAAEQREGFLTISVEDNGKGLPPDMEGAYAHRDRELSRGHLGLYNVDTILRKYYGDDSGLYLSRPKDGCGAVISATFPIHWEDTPC